MGLNIQKLRAMHYANLARMAGEKGDCDRALELAQKAVETYPVAVGYWMMGNAYDTLADKTGDKSYRSLAIKAWTQAKRINPNIIMPLAKIDESAL